MSNKKAKNGSIVSSVTRCSQISSRSGYSVKETSEYLDIPLSNVTRRLSHYRKVKLKADYKQAQPTAEKARVKQLESEVNRLEQEVANAIKGRFIQKPLDKRAKRL